jgi:UDP-N-acetyl-D-mannosaminuronate dehydrogenase
VIGLGYVRLPLAMELVRSGFRMIGFDVSRATVHGIQSGVSHITDVHLFGRRRSRGGGTARDDHRR